MGRDVRGPPSFMREARTPAGSLYLLAAVGCSSDGSGVISQLRVIPPVLKPAETPPPPSKQEPVYCSLESFPGEVRKALLGLVTAC